MPAFEIRWRSEDLKSAPETPRPAGGSLPSGTVTIPATAPPTDAAAGTANALTPASTEAHPPPALGPGAIAAIAVGSSLGVLALALGAVFLAARRRLKRRRTAGSRPPWTEGSRGPRRPQHAQPVEMEHAPARPSELPDSGEGSARARPAGPVGVFEMAAEPVAAPGGDGDNLG